MDFAFNEDQEMFRDTAKKFLSNKCPMTLVRNVLKEESGYSADLWREIAELGFLGLLIDPEHGGMGGRFLDVYPILEEIGRALFPSPFIPTAVVGVPLISKGAKSNIKEKILPSVGTGETILTLAVGEGGEEWSADLINTKAVRKGDGYVLDGTKSFVPFAGASDYIACCAKTDSGVSVFLIDRKAEGVKLTPIPSFSIDKYYKVDLASVKVPEENIIGTLGNGWELIEMVWPKAVSSVCGEMVGGLERVLGITVQFVKDREQFGVPIGSFQIIQNYCADMAIDVETSKYISHVAAWKVSEGLPCKADISIAKAWCSDAYRRVTAVALQSHGAMGFTEEYDLHYFYKQAKSLQLMTGGSSYHRELVAKEIGL